MLNIQIKNSFNGMKTYTPLLRELVVRDIKVRYRRSVLGMLWTVLNPLMMMAVMTIVFSELFASSIENFAIYYLSGYILYSFVNDSTTASLFSVVYNAALMKKVYIPKYMFPISKVASSLVNLGFSLVAMLIVMAVTRTPLKFTLIFLPFLVFYIVLFSTGLGLILSTVYVFFRDCGHFYSIVMLVWMYLTPLFYPENILPETIQSLLRFNPLYHYVNYFRDILLYGVWPGVQQNIICFGIAALIFVLGLWIFYKKQDKFILYV